MVQKKNQIKSPIKNLKSTTKKIWNLGKEHGTLKHELTAYLMLKNELKAVCVIPAFV